MPGRKRTTETLASQIGVLSHEFRLMIVGVLSEHPASANEVAAETQEPADRVRHQLRMLRNAGLIQIDHERRRRGTVERVYTVRDEDVYFSPEEMLALPERLRNAFAIELLKAIFSTTRRALARGTVANQDSLVYWNPMRVDDRGLKELKKFNEESRQRVEAIKAESAKRLKKGGTPISATSVLLWYENARRSE